MGTLTISDNSLTWKDFVPLLAGSVSIKFSSHAKKTIINSRKNLEKVLKTGKKIYGVNTGFGKLSSIKIDSSDLKTLQLNLIRSHACGLGQSFDDGIVRSIMLLKLITWTKGYSGVRIDLSNLLLSMLNNDILPIIPEQGSVGASGDLAPLAHLALSMIGEGSVKVNNKEISSKIALKRKKINPITLSSKEGISLINGTQVSTALAIKACYESYQILSICDIAAALSVEAGLCSRAIFEPKIHKVKKHKNQILTAKNIYKLLSKSEIVDSHKNCHKVQDPYSVRCVPHVHGASKDAYCNVESIINSEINSVSDNPLVFPNGEIRNSGHFHAEHIAQSLDVLSIAISEIGAISEKRINYFMNGIDDIIPQFCAVKPGIESGFMLAHVTAAALSSENKTLSHPASVDSISTSAGMEDFVSMAPWAGRKCLNIISNVRSILAIELLVSSNVNKRFHSKLKSGTHLRGLMALFKKTNILTKEDGPYNKRIEAIIELIKNDKILNTIRKTINI